MATLNVSTTVNGMTVVHTQAVHIAGAQSFDISINGYVCTVRFKSDEGGSRYIGVPADGKFYVDCYNHNNSLGESIFKPFPVAKLNEKTIWMTYYTNVVSTELNIRRFEYSLWLES